MISLLDSGTFTQLLPLQAECCVGFRIGQTQMDIFSPLLAGCVTLGKLLNLSEPQLPLWVK